MRIKWSEDLTAACVCIQTFAGQFQCSKGRVYMPAVKKAIVSIVSFGECHSLSSRTAHGKP
jgi:hypothetical protein